MGHILSTEATAANAAPDTMTRDLVIITLPDPVDPITLHLATADVTVDGQPYIGAIRSVPEIVYSDGGNADGGEFTIENLANEYGPTFLNADRMLDGSRVVIKRAWKLADGTWEDTDPVSGKSYQIAEGTLRTQPVDDNAVKCHFTVDTSDSSIVLGDEQISQHCPVTFNANGNHPLGGDCGWKPTLLQKQVETTVIEGTITTAGDARAIVTAVGMTGSPKTVDVALLLADNATAIAGKLKTALAADADVSAFFDVSNTGPALRLVAKTAAAISATMNLNVNNLTSVGIVPAPTSENTSSVFCDKLQNSVTGCSGHGNTRHRGVPGLTPTANAPSQRPQIDPGGYPSGYPQIPPILDGDNRYPMP